MTPPQRLIVNIRRLAKRLDARAAWRLLLLALLVQQIQPAARIVTPGAPQTVQTRVPQLGVHTRLIDEVEAWKIQRSLALVREVGAPWIVELFPWAYHQPQPERFDWRQADLIIDHAEAQGLRVLARISLTPAWARPADSTLNYLDRDGFAAYAAFAAAFAARYRGRVEHLIIGNEPNLAFEWGGRVAPAAEYADLLRAVYPAVKAANPAALVLAAGPAPTLEPHGSPNGLNDLLWLADLYAAGAADAFDALAAHAYGLTFPPAAPPAADVLNFRRVELLRAVMLAHADEATPIYITESGYNDHPRWTRAVRPAQRIDYTLDMIDYAVQNWPYVEVIAIWMLRTPAPTRSFLDYYTLVTPEFVEKPIYGALQAYARPAR